MKKILIMFVCWLILLNIINKVSPKVLVDNTSYELPNNIKLTHRFWITPWLNFDGRNYLEIVVNGYQSKNQKNDLRVFFPLYPLLVTILSLNKLINPVLVGLFISLVAFIFSLFIFDKLMLQEKIPKDKRLRAFILLFLFPTSFYFVAYYTESLFLVLSLLVFYFLNRRQFFPASIFAALASITRLVGLTLIPVILFEAYQNYKKTRRFPVSVLITPLGLIFYGLYTQLTTGDGLSIILNHKDWDRQISVFGIFFGLKEGLQKIIFKSALSQSNFNIYSIELVEFACAVFLIAIIITSFKKIKFSYWLYLFLNSMIFFSSSSLASIPRVMIPMFPIYLYLAKSTPRRFFYLVCLIFFSLLIYLSSLFLRGYWVA